MRFEKWLVPRRFLWPVRLAPVFVAVAVGFYLFPAKPLAALVAGSIIWLCFGLPISFQTQPQDENGEDQEIQTDIPSLLDKKKKQRFYRAIADAERPLPSSEIVAGKKQSESSHQWDQVAPLSVQTHSDLNPTALSFSSKAFRILLIIIALPLALLVWAVPSIALLFLFLAFLVWQRGNRWALTWWFPLAVIVFYLGFYVFGIVPLSCNFVSIGGGGGGEGAAFILLWAVRAFVVLSVFILFLAFPRGAAWRWKFILFPLAGWILLGASVQYFLGTSPLRIKVTNRKGSPLGSIRVAYKSSPRVDLPGFDGMLSSASAGVTQTDNNGEVNLRLRTLGNFSTNILGQELDIYERRYGYDVRLRWKLSVPTKAGGVRYVAQSLTLRFASEHPLAVRVEIPDEGPGNEELYADIVAREVAQAAKIEGSFQWTVSDLGNFAALAHAEVIVATHNLYPARHSGLTSALTELVRMAKELSTAIHGAALASESRLAFFYDLLPRTNSALTLQQSQELIQLLMQVREDYRALLRSSTPPTSSHAGGISENAPPGVSRVSDEQESVSTTASAEARKASVHGLAESLAIKINSVDLHSNKPDVLVIRGSAHNTNVIPRFMAALNNMPEFGQVNLQFSHQGREGSWDFEIRVSSR